MCLAGSGGSVEQQPAPGRSARLRANDNPGTSFALASFAVTPVLASCQALGAPQGCGHVAHEEAPARFAKIVTDLLAAPAETAKKTGTVVVLQRVCCAWGNCSGSACCNVCGLFVLPCSVLCYQRNRGDVACASGWGKDYATGRGFRLCAGRTPCLSVAIPRTVT